MLRVLPLALLFLPALPALAHARAALPPVADVDWPAFRDHCRQLLRALDAVKAPLPPDTARALRALLAAEPRDPDEAVAAVRRLLDAHCLVGVAINPEARVKAVRGPARAALVLGRPAVVLVRVHNEGGVRQPLAVAGPQVVRPGRKDEGRWLEAVVEAPAPLPPRLSGRRLEYRLLRLTPNQAGRREATLAFDAGQGTQDLGFRAEVPILFAVRSP